jgi:predicted CXXCH cytochrome family protein
MNAKAAIKAALIVGWLLAAAAFIWAGNAAPVPVDAAVEAAPKAKDHPKIGKEDCLTCHNPHSSDNAGLLKDKQPDLCGACHTDIGEKIAKSKFTHGAIKDHGCSACHDPHASDTAKFLADEPEKLCMSCHRWEETANPKNTTKHRILDTPDGMGHPLVGHPFRDVPDPSAGGKPLTCLSCHDPHVGPDRPRLKPGKAQNDFCSRCH